MFDRKPLQELEEALASGGRRPRAPAHPPLGAALASPFLPGDAYEDAESYPGWFIGGLFLVMSVALAITAALPTDWLPAELDALPGGPWAASTILGAVIGVCGSVPMYFACGAATTVGLRLAGFADASWVLGRHLGTLTMLPYAALSFVGWVVLASRWPTPAEAFAGMSWEPVFGLVGLVWSNGLLVYAAVVTYELRWWRATLILAVVPVGLTLGATVWSLGGPGVDQGFGGRGAATADIRDLRAVAPTPAKASDGLAATRPQRVTVGPLALRAPAGWRAEPLDRPTLRIDDEASRAALATAKAPWSKRLRSPLGGASLDVHVWAIPGASAAALADARVALQGAMVAAAIEAASETEQAPDDTDEGIGDAAGPPEEARARSRGTRHGAGEGWQVDHAPAVALRARYADRAERHLTVHALGPHAHHVAVIVESVAASDADRLGPAIAALRRSAGWVARP